MSDKSPPVAERFANRKQALTWLRSNGYKVSQGKFYGDCADGFPTVADDGSLSAWQVSEYGLRLSGKGQDVSGQIAADRLRSDDMRKAKAEADMAEIKAERMRREEDELWLYADDAWAVVAALVGKLRDSIRHQCHKESEKLTLVAGGSVDRSHELFEAVEEVVNAAFNEVAGGGFDLELVKRND